MMFYTIILFVALQCLSFFLACHGHGYLADPPARSSAWLFDSDFVECCSYYNHMEMFCGGTYYQWIVNGGKCSICGEAYDAKPHQLGLGDAMYLGKIVRKYHQGSTIPVTVVLTANHRGVFEFRVCNIDEHPDKDATQECLNLNLLHVVNGSTQYDVEPKLMTVHVNVSLPSNLTCKHCVFQWKYITGNSWGISDGKACLGCGTQNEEFYGCSDIAIMNESDLIDKSIKTEEIPRRHCSSAVKFSRSFDLTALLSQYCQTICSTNCDSDRTDSNYDDCRKSCEKLCICE